MKSQYIFQLFFPIYSTSVIGLLQGIYLELYTKSPYVKEEIFKSYELKFVDKR